MTKWLHLLYLVLDVVLTNFKSLPLLLQFNLLFYYILLHFKPGQLGREWSQEDSHEFLGLVQAVPTSLFLASPIHYLLHFCLGRSASPNLRPHQFLQKLAPQERSQEDPLPLIVPPNHEASHLQLSVMSDLLSATAFANTALRRNAAERGYWVSATTKRPHS